MTLIKWLPCLLLLFCAVCASATTRLTSEQAIQIAADFCHQVGGPVSEHPSAAFPAHPPRDTSGLDYRPCWLIQFEHVEVEVVDATGGIVNYSNSAADDEQGMQIAGKAIPKSDAIAIATAAFQATGQADEFVLEEVEERQVSEEPTLAASHEWYFTWRRQFQGIRYRRNIATVVLQAETGTVTDIGAGHWTPAPITAALDVGRAQADTVTTRFLAHMGIPNVTLNAITTEVIQPNNFWSNNGMEVDDQPIARVARVYWLARGGSLNTGDWFEIWIDAQTGVVIGGDETGQNKGRATKPPKPLALREMLSKAQEVRIFHYDPKQGWNNKPAAVLSKRSQAELFAALKALHPTTSAGPMALGSYKFVLKAKGRTLCELRYLPATGRVGMGSAWGVVPERFKTWMQTLKPAVIFPKPTKLALFKKLFRKS